ncbi:Nonribosomal peptide synthetase 4 [Aspergillus avenaceus]|uniref:Nonribosomal peptide synthetase 4 n=1 Tax=Aspergillus avenaceus TaxID=36643 RepID=A0A5N6U6E2_ASPAV|nr:Nonribosomal peptide synthetase 4 [Aspergillus avenaceus]
MSSSQGHADGCKSFEVIGLSVNRTLFMTSMRDEIVLLSWLIVLLRSQEDGQIRFEWAYKSQDEKDKDELPKRSLSMGEVMTGLQSKIGEVASAIRQHIATDVVVNPAATSLLLSTGPLSRTSDDITTEPVLHLELHFNEPYLQICPSWNTDNMLQFTIARHIETLGETIRMCLSHPHATIEEFLKPTTWDMDAIWGWNHQLPPSYDFCMNEMISDRAQRTPDKEAILSWDGSLTYGQVDTYSTLVACSLKDAGVELDDFVPVCFEKSRWTIVAVLAVMKAGATFALMDPTLPLARLQNMAEQISAKAMLTSRMQYDLSTSILPNGKLLVVEGDTFANSPNLQSLPALPPVSSSTLMYLIFTSGSTGTPKGVKISHGTYTSSAIPRAKAVGYTEESRVLDFASYAFDVSIDSMLLTLGNGGCLCIPSDEDRLNDINGVIRGMRINYAGLTPSVARILDADVISSLSGLGLGGEASSARDVTLWGQDTRIIIGYGPCECTIGCTINSSAATGRDYISIGPGNGAAIWIVDPNDHEKLMPVGAVGELLVDGPIVGQGYLNDPDKTAAAFIEDPRWLVEGHTNYLGRRGRLYKTGDLGRYDPDGSGGIVFAGRKDTQVKLRGQRVELGEIESQLRARLPPENTVIAEVIVPQGSGGQPTLVAFVASQSATGHVDTELCSVEFSGDQRKILSDADKDVVKVLPRYMVPTAYIPVNFVPVLISGKTDRRRLKQLGTTVDLRQLEQGTNNRATRELTEMEQRLRQAWGEILKADEEAIRPEDNFFALGGDSLSAMRLVAACRVQGLDLSVTNTFGSPTLSAMASMVSISSNQGQMEIPTFSMISQAVDSACIEASETCGTEPTKIEDIYPCTPTQESLFTFSLKSKKAYIAQRVACIPSHIELEAWKIAWEQVVAASPILRTRVAQLHDPGLQQVVLKEEVSWRYCSNLTQYLESDRNERMNLGQSLARYAIVDNLSEGKHYMVWTVHHVLYDGWSEPLVLKQVSDALQNQPLVIQTQMRNFVKFIRETDEVAMEEFWRCELDGAVGPQFPRLPSRDFLPTPDAMVERQIPLETGSGLAVTMATLIRGAWALVASQYTRSDDVVFGETLTGRDICLPGVESIVGPLIATLPVRIRIHRSTSVESYLHSVQQCILARTPYQHMGMQNIRKVSQDAQHACEAGTGLVFQPEPQYVGNELGFGQGDVVREALHFNPYPLMLACEIGKSGFRVCANFDSSLVTVTQMERILAQLEVTCAQFIKNPTKGVGEISCLPEYELNQIWKWNETAPLPFDESSKGLRADTNTKSGSTYPSAVVQWVCDPRNPALLSPIGCVGELWLEGTALPGEVTEAPAWLIAGSSICVGRSGRIQPTGDMVQLQDDGRLTFVGLKENIVPVQGHAVDIAEIEFHITRQLPPSIRAAAAVWQDVSTDADSAREQQLVIFVEQQPFEGDTVQLMSTDERTSCKVSDKEYLDFTVCAVISTNLSVALKRLDKYIRDSLPSYMIPSAYVVIDRLPIRKDSIDHGLLRQLGPRIQRSTFTELSIGFKNTWAQGSAQTNLSAAEVILRSAWAKLLKVNPEDLDTDDNFFRLGGDSVLAMKLVSNLRVQGHSLSVADIFQHMRLGDAARVLKINKASVQKPGSYKPFSLLDVNIESFLSEIVRPKLADPGWSIRDVSPVTDSQALDIRGTIQSPRTSMQYTMLYHGHGIDGEKLLRACNDLVRTHEILRTVFIEHKSSFLQVVLDDIHSFSTAHRADQDLEPYVHSICKEHIESTLRLGSPFFRAFHVESTDGQGCLVIGLSHAQYDGVSLPRILRDLEILYSGGQATEFEHFTKYVAYTRDEAIQNKSLDYWRNLLQGSELSVLAGTSIAPTDKSVFHSKPTHIIQPPEEITTASLLTAAWALVLARRLRTADVTFGSVTSGRILDMDGVENVIGPCYQITPMRVLFPAKWTSMDLLRYVQKQNAESAAHDFLGFDKISKDCTQWPSEAQFFDSLVHHQDFEDFDTMPFAGRTCKVDILSPHGDAAYPLKTVSFFRDGRVHVGVVGSEKDTEFVDGILEELVAATQELATRQQEVLALDHMM